MWNIQKDAKLNTVYPADNFINQNFILHFKESAPINGSVLSKK